MQIIKTRACRTCTLLVYNRKRSSLSPLSTAKVYFSSHNWNHYVRLAVASCWCWFAVRTKYCWLPAEHNKFESLDGYNFWPLCRTTNRVDLLRVLQQASTLTPRIACMDRRLQPACGTNNKSSGHTPVLHDLLTKRATTPDKLTFSRAAWWSTSSMHLFPFLSRNPTTKEMIE